MLTTLSGTEMNQAVTALKQQGKKVYSNVYTRSDPLRTYQAAVTENTVAFVEEDHGVSRLFFHTNAFADMKAAVNDITLPLTLDVVTKNEGEGQAELQDMGFTLLARMRRLVNRDITGIVNKITASEISGGVFGRKRTECRPQAKRSRKTRRP